MRLKHGARKWPPWLLLATAVVITAVVYWPGLTGGWVFDDYPNIVDNGAIHITPGHSTLGAWVNSAISSPSSFLHRPLASLTFSLNCELGGLKKIFMAKPVQKSMDAEMANLDTAKQLLEGA